MIILLSLVAIFVAGFIVASTKDDTIGSIMMFTSGVVLLMALLILPVNRAEIQSSIRAYYATQQTIQKARERGDNFENAAIQQKIVETNEWLATEQYWNGTIFDIWIPDEVMELKPLE